MAQFWAVLKFIPMILDVLTRILDAFEKWNDAEALKKSSEARAAEAKANAKAAKDAHDAKSTDTAIDDQLGSF